MLEPSGNFVVVATRNGASFSRRAEPLKSLDNIVVRHSRDRYILIASAPAADANPFVNNVSSGNVKVGGWVYGFDGRSGKRLWATRIPNQSFNIHQARDLPVLTFFRRYMKIIQQPNGGFQHQGTVSQMLCLDVRTGRIVHDNSAPGYDDQYEIDADPPGRRLEIRSNTQSVKFTFADKK